MKAVQGFLMDSDCFERVSGLKQGGKRVSITMIVMVFHQATH
jgi:hypothetical protein